MIKAIIFLSLVLVYIIWIYIEYHIISEILFDESLKHIKYFRHIADNYPILDRISKFISLLGDKYGLAGCIWLSYNFQN